MPSAADINHRMNLDVLVKEQLQSHGDVETAIHTLEHHFFANERSCLEQVARVGRMLGFGSSPIQQGTSKDGSPLWYFDLLSETTTRLPELARQSILMFSLAEAFGAAYDGWGTEIKK